MPPRRKTNTVQAESRAHGTLGEEAEATDDEHLLSRRMEHLTTLRNPFEVLPSTSKDARERGELRLTIPANQVDQQSTLKGAARRKKKTFRQRQVADLRAIMKLQRDTRLQIPRASFARVVREITVETSDTVSHYTAVALEALQEATEMFLTQVLQDAYLLTLHRKCLTLSLSDMILIRSLKLNM